MRFAMTIIGGMMLATAADAGRAADEPLPVGWTARGSHPQDFEMRIDESVHRGGKASGTIRSRDSYEEGFGVMKQMVRADDYLGKRVRLTGYVKAEDVAEYSGLWLRVDGPDWLVLGFDNMMDRPVKGTTDWTRCDLVLDVPEESELIAFGVMMTSEGQAWADDLELEVVGQDVLVTGMAPSREEAEERREQFKRERPDDYERELQKLDEGRATAPKRPVNLDFEGGPSGPPR